MEEESLGLKAEKIIRNLENLTGKIEKDLRKKVNDLLDRLDEEKKALHQEFVDEKHIIIDLEKLRRALAVRDLTKIEEIAKRLFKDLKIFEKIEKRVKRISSRKWIFEDIENISKDLNEIKVILNEIHQEHRLILKEIIGMMKELRRYSNIPIVASIEKELVRIERLESQIEKEI